MIAKTYNGTYSNGITLGNVTYNPVAVYGGVKANLSAALYGAAGSAWTITNHATISGTGKEGYGIRLLAGGTITNFAGGTIHASLAPAIDVTGAYGSLTNSGFVQVSDGARAAVALLGGGYVSNSVTGTITGTLADGVDIYNAPGTVLNTGSINGGSAAVMLNAGGYVSNASTGIMIAENAGISIGRAIGTVVNAGQVEAYNPIHFSNAVILGGGGTVTNLATGTLTDTTGNGVAIRGGIGTIFNAGSIGGSETIGRVGSGVYFGSGGLVMNLSGGTISGEPAIQGFGSAFTVVNSGIIASPSFAGAGIQLNAGGIVTNQRGGSISGSNGIDGGNSAMTVVNGGYISGAEDAVRFAAGYASRLIVDPGGSFVGAVDGGNTVGATVVSTLELSSGASPGTLTGLGSQFINFGSIEFDPGAGWLITGDTAGLAGTIAGFAQGETIEITGVTVTGSSYADGVLTLTEASGSATLALPGTFTTNNFAVTNLPGVGAEITVQPRTLVWVASNGNGSFASAAAWDDITNAPSPAQAAPDPADIIIFNSSDADITGTETVSKVNVGLSGTGLLHLDTGATLVAGSLDAGVIATDIGQIDLSGAGTELSVTGSATVADDGTGVLTVLNGASFSAQSLTIGNLGDSSGALVVSGANTTLTVAGQLNIGTALGTGDLTVGPGAVVNAAVVNLQGGVVLEGGVLDPTVYIENGRSTTGGFGTIASDFILLEGTILSNGSKAGKQTEVVQGTVVGGGTATINGSVSVNGPGILQIGTHDTIELTGAVLNTATTTFTDNLTPTGTYSVNNSVIDVVFQDATGLLQLDDIAGFAGTVATWKAGDSFVITGGTLSNLGVNNGNTLTVQDAGTGAGTGGIDTIIFGSAIGANQFGIVSGNTVQAVACFAKGTRIATRDGAMTVETLSVGDEVHTALGGPGKIVWIGQRAVDCSGHPRPETVWPIRIARGAISENVPVRDLFVSPDHAIYVDGVLIPAKRLLNGTTVRQARLRRVIYYHIELARHDVVLAEGLPTESYLDTGDRAKFSGGKVTALHPDFVARAWEAMSCAPLIVTGPRLTAARETLNARAARSGSRVEDPMVSAA